jgi:glycosyltransferase involved in cell wall biosynthesis
VLRRHAAAVVAIDETVRASLPPAFPVDVVHNGYDPHAGAAAASPDPLLPPKSPGTLRVAMVGNALAFKGVREFVEAARITRERGLPVEYFMVGLRAAGGGALRRLLRAAGLGHDAAEEIRAYIERHGLGQAVRLLDFTPDIGRIYRDIDVLCFPSHLDAAGRPVFEAAHWGVPSIVAMRDPQADTFVHRETGLCIEAGDPQAITEAVEYFCRNPAEVTRMGEAARRLALENFDSRRNARRMLEIYRRALGAAPRPGTAA